MGAQHKHILGVWGIEPDDEEDEGAEEPQAKRCGGSAVGAWGDDKVQEIIEGVSNACEHSFRRHIDEVGASVGRTAVQAKNSTKEVKQALSEL